MPVRSEQDSRLSNSSLSRLASPIWAAFFLQGLLTSLVSWPLPSKEIPVCLLQRVSPGGVGMGMEGMHQTGLQEEVQALGNSLMSPGLFPRLPCHCPSPLQVSRCRAVRTPGFLWEEPGPLPCPACLPAQGRLHRLCSWQSQAPPPAGDEAGTLGCQEQCARPKSWHCHPNTGTSTSWGQTPQSGKEGAWVPPGQLRRLQPQAGVV